MKKVMMWETKNVLVLLAVVAALFSLALRLTSGNFSSMVCEVIETMIG